MTKRWLKKVGAPFRHMHSNGYGLVVNDDCKILCYCATTSPSLCKLSNSLWPIPEFRSLCYLHGLSKIRALMWNLTISLAKQMSPHFPTVWIEAGIYKMGSWLNLDTYRRNTPYIFNVFIIQDYASKVWLKRKISTLSSEVIKNKFVLFNLINLLKTLFTCGKLALWW